MPASLTTDAADLADDINEAMRDALTDGDGRPRHDALTHHLAKRGLLIVDAAHFARMKLRAELVESIATDLKVEF